jgi:NADP-dependent 3-hydroxy acid dehydrogenase YdfG
VDLERLAVGAVPQRTLAVASTARLEVRAAAKALEVAQRVVADHDHVATASAVAAVGSALRHVRLPAETQASVTAGAGLNVYPRAILHSSNMSDPVFLITGASSGIGAATARQASEAGYRVVLAARSVERLKELADELGGSERALALACDVTDWDQQEAMVAGALEQFGRIDVAFANAGFGAARGFLKESPEHWRSMVLTNVYGAALTIRAALPPIKESRGHFVLTGSVAGRRALPGSLYSSTKWAVTGMGESLRQELNGTGARVTVIEPGMVDTPFFDNPVSNALHADDVARAVMFAVSQPPHVDVNEILVRPTAQEG